MSLQREGSLAAAVAGLIFSFSTLGANAAPDPVITSSGTETVFSTFGPGNSYSPNGSLVEDGPTSQSALLSGEYYSQGEGFTPSSSGNLASFNIALSSFSGTDDAHLFLADGSSGVPGTVLEGFTLTNLPIFNFSSNTPDLVNSVSHPFLNAGTTYFLYEVETGSEDNSFNQNSIDANELRTVSRNGAPYVTAPFTGGGAFSIQVTPVPEPSTIASFAVGVLGLSGLLLRARRKKAAA